MEQRSWLHTQVGYRFLTPVVNTPPNRTLVAREEAPLANCLNTGEEEKKKRKNKKKKKEAAQAEPSRRPIGPPERADEEAAACIQAYEEGGCRKKVKLNPRRHLEIEDLVSVVPQPWSTEPRPSTSGGHPPSPTAPQRTASPIVLPWMTKPRQPTPPPALKVR